MPLEKLRNTFGRTSYILRLVCTANARHAWPGDARTVGVRQRANAPPPLRDRVDALRDRVHRLMAIEPVVVTAYAGDHPLFGTRETGTLMRMFFSRLFGLIRDVQTVLAADNVPVALCDRHWLGDLNRMWVRERGAAVGPEAPPALFLMYTQLADELQFLRQVALFDRNRILGSMVPTKSRCMDCPLPGGYPPIGARLTVRQYTDWQQAYRTLFPAKYARLMAKTTPNRTPPPAAVYYTRLSLNSPYANVDPLP
jgi:hypothetical protein